ncbi:DUF6022 family protein [Paenibacillus sp. GCM10023248]|uniref:DUF6022 family protein n=1 Tax=Bacillales TaxID=1385 RepID=UPI002379987D|nr:MULTISPECIES: DUF6022 family protein [Bacillales]MDD9269013.1 DUF6022 family protein [Paenibacillus sp. MAHUQ-63]MDR6884987.1 hypothetical protein [Bacillus sp. 3255]
MRMLNEVNPDMSIGQLAAVLSDYIEHSWRNVFQANVQELAALFPELEDSTYGMYLERLIPQAWQQLERCGFHHAEPPGAEDFVIAGCLNFRDSMEKAEWGSPGHEMRIFWIVLNNRHNRPIGTLVLSFAHSHLEFNVPEQPKFEAFAETERRAIVSAILHKQGKRPQT